MQSLPTATLFRLLSYKCAVTTQKLTVFFCFLFLLSQFAKCAFLDLKKPSTLILVSDNFKCSFLVKID